MSGERQMSMKQILQLVGIVLMVSGFWSGRSEQMWRPKTFYAGVLIFALTFLTWKRRANNDH
jgi:hypothetical protein